MARTSDSPRPAPGTGFARRVVERLVSAVLMSLPLLWLTTWQWAAATAGALATALIGAEGYARFRWRYQVRRAFGSASNRALSPQGNPSSRLDALIALQSMADDADEERRTHPSAPPGAGS